MIVGHGDFPQGLFSAAEKIVGKQGGVEIVSNAGLDVTSLIAEINSKLESPERRIFVFVDLIGGSCFTACRALVPKHPDWVFIAGVNLPMLVTYLSYRTRLSGEELLCKTLEAGIRGIKEFRT